MCPHIHAFGTKAIKKSKMFCSTLLEGLNFHGLGREVGSAERGAINVKCKMSVLILTLFFPTIFALFNDWVDKMS